NLANCTAKQNREGDIINVKQTEAVALMHYCGLDGRTRTRTEEFCLFLTFLKNIKRDGSYIRCLQRRGTDTITREDNNVYGEVCLGGHLQTCPVLTNKRLDEYLDKFILIFSERNLCY
ncbi:hypothetical protein ACJX0J_025561, partial [Zea mays]